MKWMSVIGIICVLAIMIAYEWPRINKTEKKEKWAFLVLTMSSGILAIVLLFFPTLPGPSQWVHTMFKPLSKILK
ncbi:hypothetical protein [Niallia sp. 01092]|uniref:hypothetical protein n=1 Tax=unclassified Niallia TaxID=2837522 RepID=UPI003FD1AE8D